MPAGDTNQDIDSVCSNPKDIFFGDRYFLPGDSDESSDEGKNARKKVNSSLITLRNYPTCSKCEQVSRCQCKELKS